jgi:hypothetical protein
LQKNVSSISTYSFSTVILLFIFVYVLDPTHKSPARLFQMSLS